MRVCVCSRRMKIKIIHIFASSLFIFCANATGFLVILYHIFHACTQWVHERSTLCDCYIFAFGLLVYRCCCYCKSSQTTKIIIIIIIKVKFLDWKLKRFSVAWMICKGPCDWKLNLFIRVFEIQQKLNQIQIWCSILWMRWDEIVWFGFCKDTTVICCNWGKINVF